MSSKMHVSNKSRFLHKKHRQLVHRDAQGWMQIENQQWTSGVRIISDLLQLVSERQQIVRQQYCVIPRCDSTCCYSLPERAFTLNIMSKEEKDRPGDCLFTSTPSRESLDGVVPFLQQSKPDNISQFSFPSIETFNNPRFQEVRDAPSISPTEFADIKSDSADPRAPSPSVQSVSSVASTQRLEWDSGADIGYGGSKSMFGLSTLERMAIGSCCSAYKQIEPKRDCAQMKSDSDDHVQRGVEDHFRLPEDPEIDNSEVEDLESEMSSLRMHISKLEALDETGNQIKAYRRHLALKEFEEDSMLPPKSTSWCAVSERFDKKFDINARIMALKIAEKRSSSMNDLSDPDGKKNCYLNKFKRIHSYSTFDVSPAKQPTNTPGSISSSCSAVSLNSSNTVKNCPLQSCNTCEVVMPKMSTDAIGSDNVNTSVSENSAKLSCEKATTCNTKVVQYVTNFVDKLFANSGEARKQRLLRKILGDLGVSMQADNDEDKLLDCQHDEQSDIELQNKSSSQHMPFNRDLVVEQKSSNSPDNNVNVGDFGLVFHGQQCSSTDSRNAEVSVSATEYPDLSSSERDSTSLWIEMQQLKDVESITSRSSVDSSERLSEELVYPHWRFVRTENQCAVMDRKTVPSTWCIFNDRKHMVPAQQENLELVKESVRQQWRRNIQRLQKDKLWLKHVEAMLHAEQVKQAKTISEKYRLQDVQVQCTLDESRNSREYAQTKDSEPSSRGASIFLCLPSTLTSGIPATFNDPVKHLRSIGTQTSFTRSNTFIVEKEKFNSYSKEKPVISISQPVRRLSADCHDEKQPKSSELFNKVLEEQQPRAISWFLPLNDSQLRMSRAGRNVLRNNLRQIGGFSHKKDLEQLMPDNNLTNEMSKKFHGKMGIMNPNLSTNNNVDLEEIQGGFRKYTVPVSFSSQHHNPKYRRLSHNAMQKQTEKVYSILPEVTAKNELKHRRDVYKTNRLMAQIFQKNLQQKVLAGRSSYKTTEKCQC